MKQFLKPDDNVAMNVTNKMAVVFEVEVRGSHCCISSYWRSGFKVWYGSPYGFMIIYRWSKNVGT